MHMSAIMLGTRTIIAWLVSPLVPGVLVALPDIFKGDLTIAGWYIEFSAMAGYPVALVLGVPLYFLSRRRGWTRLTNYLFVGVILGMAAYFGAFLPSLANTVQGAGYAIASALIFLPMSALCGVVATLTFWLIARPDRVRAA